MNREEFLDQLRLGLADLPTQEIDEILADYGSYFDEAHAVGRNADDVASALGDPGRLARELRAEMGLRRWERDRSPRSFFMATLALGGLATVDVFVLLPLMLVLGLIALVACFVLSLLGIIGLGHLLSLMPFGDGAHVEPALTRLFNGIGLVASSLGGALVLALSLKTAMTLLARYARLHYRLFKPALRVTAEANSDVGSQQ